MQRSYFDSGKDVFHECSCIFFTYPIISLAISKPKFSSSEVPVAWQSTPEQKVALRVVSGGRLRAGSGAGSERSFTGWGYRDSPMVGIQPYRVAFERGVGRVERAVCAAERPAECAVRPIQISWASFHQRGSLLCARKVLAEYIVGGTHAHTTSFGDLRRRCHLHRCRSVWGFASLNGCRFFWRFCANWGPPAFNDRGGIYRSPSLHLFFHLFQFLALVLIYQQAFRLIHALLLCPLEQHVRENIWWPKFDNLLQQVMTLQWSGTI